MDGVTTTPERIFQQASNINGICLQVQKLTQELIEKLDGDVGKLTKEGDEFLHNRDDATSDDRKYYEMMTKLLKFTEFLNSLFAENLPATGHFRSLDSERDRTMASDQDNSWETDGRLDIEEDRETVSYEDIDRASDGDGEGEPMSTSTTHSDDCQAISDSHFTLEGDFYYESMLGVPRDEGTHRETKL